MENIFKPEQMENWGESFEKKVSGISANSFLCAAAGSLLLAGTLKLAGKKQAGSFFGKWTIPLLAIGCYKKFKDSSISEDKNIENNEKEKDNLTEDTIAST